MKKRLSTFNDFKSNISGVPGVTHLREADESGENKYSNLSTSDLTFIPENRRAEEISLLNDLVGGGISEDNHPMVNIGYFFRYLYSTFSNTFNINTFGNVYLPKFMNDMYARGLDIIGLYSKYSEVKEEDHGHIEKALNDINGILRKIGSNISEKAFNTYIKADDDIEFILPKGRIDYTKRFTDLDKNIMLAMWRVHRFSKNTKYHFRGYPYSLLGIMFSTEDYPKTFMDRFLKINVSGGGMESMDVLKHFDRGQNVFSLGAVIDSVEDIFEDSFFDDLSDRFSSFWDTKTEDAVYNIAMSLFTLFYIKSYLDFTYKKFVDPNHSEKSIKHSAGVNKSKSEEAAKSIVPKIVKAAPKAVARKYKGTFAGDTGDGILKEGVPASQEVANMQVTLAVLISDLINHKALDKIAMASEIRVRNAIEHIKAIDTDRVTIGKSVKIVPVLNDGIYGFRTRKMVEIIQSYIKKFSKISDDLKNAVNINGIYDGPTRAAVEALIKTQFNKVAEITTGKIAEPELSGLVGRPASKEESREILDLIKGDKNLASAYNAKDSEDRKESLAVISTAIKGLSGEAKKIVISNILSGGDSEKSGNPDIASAGASILGDN